MVSSSFKIGSQGAYEPVPQIDDMASNRSLPSPDGKMDSKDNQFHELAPDADRIDLAYNVAARVVNPLAHKTREQLLQDVEIFCNQHGFRDELELFQKGALVAQHPSSYMDLDMLTDEDRYHLEREHTHRWKHPFALYFTIAVLSLGSAIQGWDNTGVNGATLSYPQEFGIADRPWLVGVVNSGLTITGLVFAWTSDIWNRMFGRRGTVFMTNLFCVGPIMAQGFTHTWQELFIIRLIAGAGLGVKLSTIPIYSSEIAPANIRGALTMQFQTWVAFGIMVGFSVNLIFSEATVGHNAWRFQLASAFVPAVPVMLLCWFCPESPRWLLQKHRFRKAFDAWCRLRNSRLQAARDLYYSWAQIAEEERAFGDSTFFGRIRDLLAVPRIRRATYACGIAMLSQQLCGISIMSFYSSTIFVEGGYTNQQALIASFAFATLMFITAIPAWFCIDRFGRRSLLLVAFPIMAICLFITAGVFSIDTASKARMPLILVFVYIYTAAYGLGMGPIPNVVASEAFPLSHRATGGGFGIFINNFFSTVLGLTFPSMLSAFGGSGAFAFYGATSTLALCLIFLCLPETKERTLEELDYIFAVPTGKFASYQLFTWLPHQFKKNVLRQNVHLEPLYHLDEVAGSKTYATVVAGH